MKYDKENLTNDLMDDLVKEWHDKIEGMSLEIFIHIATGLSKEEIKHWVETAELPNE